MRMNWTCFDSIKHWDPIFRHFVEIFWPIFIKNGTKFQFAWIHPGQSAIVFFHELLISLKKRIFLKRANFGQNFRESNVNVFSLLNICMKREIREARFSPFFVICSEKFVNFCVISCEIAEILWIRC